MTKIHFLGLFLLSDIISLCCFLIVQRKKNGLGRAIANLSGLSALATTVYIFTLLFNTYTELKIIHGVYFALMGWLCLAMLSFIAEFTESHRYSKFSSLFSLIVIVDSISQLLNIVFNHALYYNMTIIGGEMFFELIPKLPFSIHLGICYTLIGLSVLLLIRKVFDFTRFYRIQYLTVLIIIALIVVVNAVFLFTNLGVDVSMISYGFAAGLLTFYVLYLFPKRLTTKMSGIVLNKMNATILLFDTNETLIYHNEAGGLKYFQETDLESVCSRLQLKIPDKTENYRAEVTIKGNLEKQILDIQYILLLEKTIKHGDICVGSYMIIENITKQREQLLQREYRATHDELTGTYNRSYFCECAQKLLKERSNEVYVILMTNFYQFKLFNEVFGREAGDKLLKSCAQKLRSLVRENAGIMFCRYEADRFALCIPLECCTEEYFRQNSMYEAEQPIKFQIINYMGICEVTDIRTPVSVLCERAAIALNTIKGDSTKRLAFYDHRMRDELLREKELSMALPEAIKKGHIKLFVQPQINQNNGNFVGGEVLARWINSEGHVISPAEFIPILEKNGQITELDRYIWEEACKLSSELYHRGMGVPLSVNLSAQDFFRCDVYETFTSLTEKYNLPPEYLRLEITEKEIMSDIDRQIVLIQKLQQKGFIIEMDDFGSGYSSLNTLKDIPVDVLKMDMRFLENSDQKERGQVIIKSITAMAQELGLPIIAEGVEHQTQADFLRSVHCKYIQGYLYGKPMPTEDFVNLRMQNEYSDLK